MLKAGQLSLVEHGPGLAWSLQTLLPSEALPLLTLHSWIFPRSKPTDFILPPAPCAPVLTSYSTPVHPQTWAKVTLDDPNIACVSLTFECRKKNVKNFELLREERGAIWKKPR